VVGLLVTRMFPEFAIGVSVATRFAELGLTDTWDTLKPMLETVDLRPEDAIDPPSARAANWRH